MRTNEPRNRRRPRSVEREATGSADSDSGLGGTGLEVLPTAVLEDPVFDGHPSPTGGTALAELATATPDRAAAERVATSEGTPARWVGVREWAAGFLLAQRSGHTRRAYAGDLTHFLGWCVTQQLAPGRVARADLDRYARTLELTPSARTGRPPAKATVARRLACLSGFYRYAVTELGLRHSPAEHLARPRTGTATPLGPTRTEVAALLTAAREDSPRAHALVALLVHTGLRIDEALSRDLEHWRRDAGHDVLALTRKGGADAVTVLPAPVVRALSAATAGRAAGPLFATGTGRRLDQPAAWRLLRRLAVDAGLEHPQRLSPHALRHAFVTFALDAGASLRDVQDAAGHADPATTRAYDLARGALDRHPAYAVSAHLAAAPTPTPTLTASDPPGTAPL